MICKIKDSELIIYVITSVIEDTFIYAPLGCNFTARPFIALL